jgi:hypothetical protein
MRCYRFDLHRKFVHCMHGRLPSNEQNKLDHHLSKCADCRNRIERLRSVETALTDITARKAPGELWPKIESRLTRIIPNSTESLWKRAAVIAAIGLISGLIGAGTYGKLSRHENFPEAGFNANEFKAVPIQGMADTTEPHVVTEGYVAEARVEENDGDRVFKLVDRLNSSGPFVICEVIEPLEMPIPPVGSRVRVYGVSRFDSKSDHNWQEVHPVLNIEVLKN